MVTRNTNSMYISSTQILLDSFLSYEFMNKEQKSATYNRPRRSL